MGQIFIDRVPVWVSEWFLGSFVLILILILSICPTQPIFTNTETAILSRFLAQVLKCHKFDKNGVISGLFMCDSSDESKQKKNKPDNIQETNNSQTDNPDEVDQDWAWQRLHVVNVINFALVLIDTILSINWMLHGSYCHNVVSSSFQSFVCLMYSITDDWNDLSVCWTNNQITLIQRKHVS